MSSGGNGGDEGSSRPPATPPRTGGNASPRGRGSPSRRPRGPNPPIGGSSHSAFTPYTRPPPPPPQPHWLSGGSGGPGLGGGIGGGLAVPVGGSGSGSGSGGVAPLRIGGSPAARKRVREGGAAGGNPPPPAAEGAGNQVSCSICGKVFQTPKALFGHMRSHPGRGWKGAHPPPTFKAEEEFADLQMDRLEQGGGAEAEAGAGEEEGEAYQVPDLNNPPPPDAE